MNKTTPTPPPDRAAPPTLQQAPPAPQSPPTLTQKEQEEARAALEQAGVTEPTAVQIEALARALRKLNGAGGTARQRAIDKVKAMGSTEPSTPPSVEDHGPA